MPSGHKSNITVHVARIDARLIVAGYRTVTAETDDWQPLRVICVLSLPVPVPIDARDDGC